LAHVVDDAGARLPLQPDVAGSSGPEADPDRALRVEPGPAQDGQELLAAPAHLAQWRVGLQRQVEVPLSRLAAAGDANMVGLPGLHIGC
jgi:hypothetical protein